MNKYQNIKEKVLQIINADNQNYLPSKLFDILIVSLIIMSAITMMLSTIENMPSSFQTFNTYFELISVFTFTLEYILRIWTSDLLYDCGKIKSRIKYIFSFMAVIDLIAILPFYLSFLPIDLRALRLLRLVRMIRVFKLNRYTNAFSDVVYVLRSRKEQLLSSVFVVMLLIIISSVFMYYCEHDVQPDKFDNAFSGLWWAIATLTTIGYGDIYPITALGKVISALIALLGIGLVAIPSGIISSGFTETLDKKKDITYIEEIKQLNELLNDKIITQEEFDTKKKELLNN